MKQPEADLQKACVRWFRYQYRDLMLFSIPNSNDMSASDRQKAVRVMAKLKATGLVPGVADLFLAVPNSFAHGLFIEMKAKGGRQSPAQKQFQEIVMEAKYCYDVIDNFDDFVKLIEYYLKGSKNG